MKIISKKLTDEEFVEKIRKNRKKTKVFAIVYLICNLILLGYILYIFSPVVDPDSIVHLMIFNDDISGKYGLITGLGVGFSFAVLIFVLIINIGMSIMILRQPRIQRLLIKYYNMSKENNF